MVTRTRIAAAVIAAALSISSTAAGAATVTFTGTATNANSPPSFVPGSRCSPGPILNIGPGGTSGMSNFGAFTYTQNHCPAGVYTDGVFKFSFAGDELEGSYSGMLTPFPPPSESSVVANEITFLVTGGTGRFAGGTGTIMGLGDIVFAPGQNPVATLDLNGTLNLPAIPEPATWMSMILGMGAIGGALRRRRATRGAPVAC